MDHGSFGLATIRIQVAWARDEPVCDEGANSRLCLGRLCCNFQRRTALGWHGTRLWFLQGQPEQFADEPNLTPNIIATDPPNLPFPNHVHRFITVKHQIKRLWRNLGASAS